MSPETLTVTEDLPDSLDRLAAYLSIRSFAKLADFEPSSIRKKIDKGQIKCVRTRDGSVRIPVQELQRFLSGK